MKMSSDGRLKRRKNHEQPDFVHVGDASLEREVEDLVDEDTPIHNLAEAYQSKDLKRPSIVK